MQGLNVGVLDYLKLVAVLTGAAALYFPPAPFAEVRRTRNCSAVLAVNFFFGWTVLGWIVALAMSRGGQSEDSIQEE